MRTPIPPSWKHRLYDLLVILLALILINRGIPWGAKRLLRHAPDLQRALAVVLVLGWFRWGPTTLTLKIVGYTLEFLRRSKARYAVLGAWAAFAVFVSVLQTQALQYTQYDVGIFHQVLWSLSEGLGPWSSISKAGNFWHDHLALSLTLLVPGFVLSGRVPIFCRFSRHF